MKYICLLFSLTVHEAAHAAMANRCGDPSARLLGRMSLNPIKHIDPIGTVVMPLLMIFTSMPFAFGWAKPVPFNPRNLGNVRRDPVWIGLAGPAANIILAVACTLILRIFVVMNGETAPDELMGNPLSMILVTMIMLNMVLALFNCIPVPPLDGSHLLYSILPESGKRVMEQFGPFGLIIAIMIGGRLIGPPLEFFFRLFLTYALFGFPW